MSDTFIKWFFRIWVTAGIINGAIWLWRNFPLGLVLIALSGLLILRAIRKEQQQRQRDGYWLEFLSAGVLRGDNDEFAIVYHQGDKQHFFNGRKGQGGAPDVLTIPSQLVWRLQMPEGMGDQRELILKRIEQGLQKYAKGKPVRIVVSDKAR